MTLGKIADVIACLSIAFNHDIKDDTVKKKTFQMAVGGFVSGIGWAALSYGYHWGWILFGVGTLLDTITYNIPATYNYFFAKPQSDLDNSDDASPSAPPSPSALHRAGLTYSAN